MGKRYGWALAAPDQHVDLCRELLFLRIHPILVQTDQFAHSLREWDAGLFPGLNVAAGDEPIDGPVAQCPTGGGCSRRAVGVQPDSTDIGALRCSADDQPFFHVGADGADLAHRGTATARLVLGESGHLSGGVGCVSAFGRTE